MKQKYWTKPFLATSMIRIPLLQALTFLSEVKETLHPSPRGGGVYWGMTARNLFNSLED